MPSSDNQYNAVWEYLKDVELQVHHFPTILFRHLWGNFVHNKALRLLKWKMQHNSCNNANQEDYITSLFPELEILSVDFYSAPTRTVRNSRHRVIGFDIRCDFLVLVHAKKSDDTFVKKCIMFEVKFGASQITRKQLTYYKDVIEDPSKYIKKADEVRVFYLWVEGFDQIAGNMFYRLKELKAHEIPNTNCHAK